uniref:DM2 domain-containing protein n=1 Tax=viral metagenome TaxID=1070528 RepID=A0A6C0C7M4_9ZZZZ
MPKQTNKAKKSAPKNSKKSTPAPAPVVEAPVVDTPVVDTPVVDTSTGDNVPSGPVMMDYSDEFTTLRSQLSDALSLVKSLTSAVVALERRVARDKKVVDKKMKTKVKRVRDPNAPPTGFQKPLNVSDELRKFLGIAEGELIARTEVTKAINAYCKEHSLQKEEDKRTIKPDKVLTKLLRIQKGDELTFFNLQKYLKPHYPNKDGTFA